MLRKGHDHETLCKLAYEFRNTKSNQELQHIISTNSDCSIWPFLRHVIGRLGSWVKASKQVVSMSKKRRDIFERTRVEPIEPLQGALHTTTGIEITLEGALTRNFPRFHHSRVSKIMCSASGQDESSIAQKFTEAYRKRKSRSNAHAELTILEHFYANGLEFLDNDRYIGCSKRSCYCCDIYMRMHPSQPALRPCHGRIWKNWRFPSFATIPKNPRNKHPEELQHQMLAKIKSDLEIFVVVGSMKRAYMRDSTTGFSDTATSRERN